VGAIEEMRYLQLAPQLAEQLCVHSSGKIKMNDSFIREFLFARNKEISAPKNNYANNSEFGF